MAECVLDSSAVLALFLQEPGGDLVLSLLHGAAVSAVNLCEIGSRLVDRGVPLGEVDSLLNGINPLIVDLTYADAVVAAALRAITRPQGLSLGDRCCLALTSRLDLPVYTADRRWLEAKLPIDIRLIR